MKAPVCLKPLSCLLLKALAKSGTLSGAEQKNMEAAATTADVLAEKNHPEGSQDPQS